MLTVSVTITWRSICIACSDCDNNGRSICSVNIYCENNGGVYMQCKQLL